MKQNRVGTETTTNQGYVIKCISYDDAHNIVVEFQDKFKAHVHTGWNKFKDGGILNPYHPNKYGGMVGNKYPSALCRKAIKEYFTWHNMLKRCLDKTEKKRDKSNSYENVTCCEEWLLYENFYEWVHSQDNLKKLIDNDIKFTIDKDILVKGNKIYSPETCCLIPEYVNKLFIKHTGIRGKYPIGVSYHKASNSFVAKCNDGTGRDIHLGCYSSPEKAFIAYKNYKEKLIKQIAKEEFDKGNITKKCYEAMMSYEVEITD